jgi:uncharacterized protein (DUF58 family)
MRLTRAGWAVLAVGVVALGTARTLQMREVWMIAATLLVTLAVAAAMVALTPDRLELQRQVTPRHVQVGTHAEIRLDVQHPGRRWSPTVTLDVGNARHRVPPLAPHTATSVTWPLATSARGVHHLPAVVVRRLDPLGLVQRARPVCNPLDVVVAPRTLALDMPRAGAGMLGSMLIHRARQFGVGEFEGLRSYVEGDDLRLVHWKASARSVDLLVRQFSMEGARRCTVVLDTSTPRTAEGFETAVAIAASLVEAAELAGLTPRLVTTGGLDLSGDDVGQQAYIHLALVQPDRDARPIERDPAEGLGLVIGITPSVDSDVWRDRQTFSDPLLVPLVITERPPVPRSGICASSLDEFAAAWQALVTATTNPGASR